MSKYDAILHDVREYYEQKIKETGFKMVPGHYPVLTTKEEVDRFFSMMDYMRRSRKESKE